MAHIVFVTPYFPPEVGAAQIRISENAARLAARGHAVTVLTTLPNYPLGVVPPEYHNGRNRSEMRDGVRVERVWSYVSPNKGFLRRILSQLSFGCLAPFLAGRRIGRPDILIVESPPLFDAFAGRMLARRSRCPYIFTVADIWPESAVQLGALRNRFLVWLAERLEWSTYRRAGAVWSVTAGIRQELIRRGLPPQKIFLLTNGVDTMKFHPQPRDEARAALGWDDRFTLLYAGTLGLAHDLGTLLHAAALLRDRGDGGDIRIVLAGEGAAKADLIAETERRGLDNVTFLPAQPHERMPTLIAAADVCLASLRKVPLFEGALPSKMYEAMACARPLLLAVDGEARELIERQAGAALYVEPENAGALAAAILRLRDDPALAAELGAHGRAFVEAHFDRNALAVALEARIAVLLGNAPDDSAVTRHAAAVTSERR
jgi:glycosyltransferase involved in cell wall biosynthesis